MRLTVRACGTEEDEDDEVLEAAFSEGEDGTGTAIMFQRNIFADDPWKGSEDETDFFNNSYCVTTGAGATSYGGVVSIDLSQQPAVFKLSPRVANTLKLDEVIEVDFNRVRTRFRSQGRSGPCVAGRVGSYRASGSRVPHCRGASRRRQAASRLLGRSGDGRTDCVP